MAKTLSTMQQLGSTAPDFKLPNYQTSNAVDVALNDFHGQSLLVAFICNHCPYVVHISKQLADFAKEYQSKGLQVVAINANDITKHPDDAPQKMVEFSQHNTFSFPYLFDESQQIAQAYAAACTPDFFLYNKQHELVYRGQFDDSRPGNKKPVSGIDMRQAADALLSEQAVPQQQTPSMGCNIKWKPGNEPDYF